MDLNKLEGNIIGILSTDKLLKNDYKNKKVKDIIPYKFEQSLKMVGLKEEIANVIYEELSSREKSKVILASKLNEKIIVLENFSKGLIKKDFDNFKRLFKRLTNYNKKIILIDNNLELFLNCVDSIYIIDNDKIAYKTDNIFDPTIYLNSDSPKIVEFTYLSEDEGIHIDEYKELDELIKAIYRIKS